MTIVADPFLPQSFEHFLIGFLDGLGFIVLDHDFVESVFENSDVAHEGVFLNVAKFVFLYFFEFVLEVEEHGFFLFGEEFFAVEQSPEVIFIFVIDGVGGDGGEGAVVVGRVPPFLFAVGDELVPDVFQMQVLIF